MKRGASIHHDEMITPPLRLLQIFLHSRNAWIAEEQPIWDLNTHLHAHTQTLRHKHNIHLYKYIYSKMKRFKKYFASISCSRVYINSLFYSLNFAIFYFLHPIFLISLQYYFLNLLICVKVEVLFLHFTLVKILNCQVSNQYLVLSGTNRIFDTL